MHACMHTLKSSHSRRNRKKEFKASTYLLVVNLFGLSLQVLLFGFGTVPEWNDFLAQPTRKSRTVVFFFPLALLHKLLQLLLMDGWLNEGMNGTARLLLKKLITLFLRRLSRLSCQSTYVRRSRR